MLQVLQLNQNHDPKDEHHVVRSYDHFSFQGHLCIVFELLGNNLFELLQRNQLKGISLNLVQIFLKQVKTSCRTFGVSFVLMLDLALGMNSALNNFQLAALDAWF
jgi:dual specificity protein kinase YAK1